MTTQVNADLFGTDMALDLDGAWTTYWVAFLRIITGYWMFHAGLTKLLEGGFQAGGWLTGATQGTLVHPITAWFGANAVWFVNMAIPAGEFLIGLGLMVGALTRLAAFFGVFLMGFFYLGNAGFGHGFVNGDLMGLLLFATMIVLGAGRAFGLDGYLEDIGLVKQYPRLRYLMG